MERVYIGFPHLPLDNQANMKRLHQMAQFLEALAPPGKEEIDEYHWMDIITGNTAMDVGYWEEAMQLYSYRHPDTLVKVTFVNDGNDALYNSQDNGVIALFTTYYWNGHFYSSTIPVEWPTYNPEIMKELSKLQPIDYEELEQKLKGGYE